MFLAPRMVPHFNAIWGLRKVDESAAPEPPDARDPEGASQRVGDGTADLRADSGVKDRATFTRALDELQAAMLVIPEAVVL